MALHTPPRSAQHATPTLLMYFLFFHDLDFIKDSNKSQNLNIDFSRAVSLKRDGFLYAEPQLKGAS